MAIISRRCFICTKSRNVEYDPAEYRAWQEGALIQDAMPTMAPEDREMLISSVCPPCFHELGFGDDEE